MADCTARNHFVPSLDFFLLNVETGYVVHPFCNGATSACIIQYNIPSMLHCRKMPRNLMYTVRGEEGLYCDTRFEKGISLTVLLKVNFQRKIVLTSLN